MKDVYHRTVGRNCLLELDLTPDRNGLIPASYAARYKELGDFIRSCYGAPIPGKHSVHPDGDEGVYRLSFDTPTTIDRIMLMEDQAQGQVIRSYGVYARVVDKDGGDEGSASGNGKNTPWTKVSNGTSIGHKKIDLFDSPVAVMEVMVNTTFVDTPRWRSVSVHLCD